MIGNQGKKEKILREKIILEIQLIKNILTFSGWLLSANILFILRKGNVLEEKKIEINR